MVLTNDSVFNFYEGTDPAHYTDLTGVNLNAASNALLANDVAIKDAVTATENSIQSLQEGLVTFVTSESQSHLSTDNSTNINLNYGDSLFHDMTLANGINLAVSGFVDGTLCELVLKLQQGGSYAITFNQPIKWVVPDGTTTLILANTGVTLNSDGSSDFVLFWSADGGATIFGKVLR